MSFQVLVGVALQFCSIYEPGNGDCDEADGRRVHRLITMIITVIIFCTVVTGIAGMQDLKKVGRVGGKALIYFEVVSTLALLIGLVVGNVARPGSGFNINPALLDVKAVADVECRQRVSSICHGFNVEQCRVNIESASRPRYVSYHQTNQQSQRAHHFEINQRFPPTRPTFLRSCMPAMPVTTVQKMITVIIMVINRMKRVAHRLHRSRRCRAHISEQNCQGHAYQHLKRHSQIERLFLRISRDHS